MESLQKYMEEYKKQLAKGSIQQAYQGLMKYMREVKSYLVSQYPDYFTSSSIYAGYMDMTYFSFFPESLKQRHLKIAIVFLHEEFRFEVWLSGVNRGVQRKYWEILSNSNWDMYQIVSPNKGIDAIVTHVIEHDPNFDDLDTLTTRIEHETISFIRDIETFLSTC